MVLNTFGQEVRMPQGLQTSEVNQVNMFSPDIVLRASDPKRRLPQGLQTLELEQVEIQ
jgi:hypothetical protein